jgi:hypothetical protein
MPTPAPTPFTDCTQSNGSAGVLPPQVSAYGSGSTKVNGLSPSAADAAITRKGLVPDGRADLTASNLPRQQVQIQIPDATLCVPTGSIVKYHYRP